ANSFNIWIDHCTVGASDDGAIDITDGSVGVTLSWIHFRNHNKTLLIGNNNSKTGDAAMRVTIHNCWFDSNERRQPFVRFAWVHMFNNLHEDWGTGTGGGENFRATYNCQILSENSIFSAGVTKTGVLFSDGIFTFVDGNVRLDGTLLENGAQEVERNPGSVFTPSYDYTAATANAALKTLIKSEAGWQPASYYGL
ncbi:MAG: hypothetical protein AAF709_21330, partial [Pseudomonadota bacterium]